MISKNFLYIFYVLRKIVLFIFQLLAQSTHNMIELQKIASFLIRFLIANAKILTEVFTEINSIQKKKINNIYIYILMCWWC